MWKHSAPAGLLVLAFAVAFPFAIAEAGARPQVARRAAGPAPAPVNFGPIHGLTGSPLTRVVTLRSKPDASAPVVGTIEDIGYDSLEVMGTTRDAVHVRYKGKEGWASIKDVVLDGAAVIVESATGAVVARLPAPSGDPLIAFSPDGSRAAVFSRYSLDGTSVGYELRTSDWTIVRGLGLPKRPADQPGPVISALFYRPDGALHAAVTLTDQDNMSTVRVVKVGVEGAPAGAALWSSTAGNFSLSPDGRLGFAVLDRPANAPENAPSSIVVVDLATMKTRNTMRVASPPVLYGGDLVLNESGSELYVTTETSVLVLDTTTGRQVRALQPGFAAGEAPSIAQSTTVGDALLVTTYGSETTGQRSVWMLGGTPTPASNEITFLARAGTDLFATDSVGDNLFKLDASRRIASKIPVERPELVPGWRSRWQPVTVTGLDATTDGKFLVLFVGVPQEH